MHTIIYGPDKYKKYFTKITNPKINRKIGVVKIEKGTVLPYGRPFEIGVYDKNFNFVPESCVMEKAGRHKKIMPHKKQINYVNEDVLYIGDMHWHFGHFLLEHLDRLWPLLSKKYKNMKCVIMHKNIMNNKNYSYIYKILNIFGIKQSQLIIVSSPTKFKNIFIPESTDNYMYTSPEFNKTFDRFADNVKSKHIKKYQKVYVSREKMGNRRVFGEKYISNIFKQNGFHVIYPEKLSLIKQIQIISNCKVLAGCAGTALHLALFMKKGGTVIQLKRNRKNKDNCVAQNHINNMRGLNGVFIYASVEKYLTDHYTSVPQLIGLTPYLKMFLKDNSFIVYDNINQDSEYQKYIQSVNQYRQLHGSTFSIKIKKFIIKISACFVPGRTNRADYRKWLKKKFGLQ